MSERKIRIQFLSGARFPWYFPTRILLQYFEAVDARPDVVILPALNDTAEETRPDLSKGFDIVATSTPSALFFTIDRWEGDGVWKQQARALASATTVTFGHQLPINHDSTSMFVPLLLPALVEQVPRFVPPRQDSFLYDLFFSGAYEETGSVRPWPAETRDRSARGCAIRELRKLNDHRSLCLRRTFHWRSSEVERKAMRLRYQNDLDASLVSFSPPGYGFNCHRHSDTWARGRLLLTVRLNERVLVPQPDLWEADVFYVPYEASGDDLLQQAEWAIESIKDLWGRAAAGWEYYERWGTPRRQVEVVAETLLAIL